MWYKNIIILKMRNPNTIILKMKTQIEKLMNEVSLSTLS